jgi:hypothetical protein
VAVHIVKDNPGGSYIEHNQTSGDNSIHAIILDDIVSLVSKPPFISDSSNRSNAGFKASIAITLIPSFALNNVKVPRLHPTSTKVR